MSRNGTQIVVMSVWKKANTTRLTAAAATTVKTRFACPMAFLPAVPPTSSVTSESTSMREQSGWTG